MQSTINRLPPSYDSTYSNNQMPPYYPQQQQTGVQYMNYSPSTADDPVDSALLNAMSNPRERMVLFQIENTILSFVQSK